MVISNSLLSPGRRQTPGCPPERPHHTHRHFTHTVASTMMTGLIALTVAATTTELSLRVVVKIWSEPRLLLRVQSTHGVTMDGTAPQPNVIVDEDRRAIPDRRPRPQRARRQAAPRLARRAPVVQSRKDATEQRRTLGGC
jgi:hypothetical protein